MGIKSLVLVLNDIRSTLNVGAIMRTGDGVGVEKIYLCGITATPKHPKVIKTALGAENFVKWEYRKNITVLLKKLKKEEYQCVSLEIDEKSINIWDAHFGDKVALIVGNEITGIDSKIIEQSDLAIHIPMFGEKESLNVATATGIATYEIKRSLNVVA
ncbi:MAG: TrmH family RNA methyltransferase [bacterium]